MVKKISAVIFLVLLLGVGYYWFSSSRQTIADKNGNPIRYTYEDIEAEQKTGLFVHNADDTFSPCIQTVPNFAGSTDKSSADRFLWYVDGEQSITDYIPTVSGDSELVVVYNVDGDLRGSYYLEKYIERGYTIGAHFLLTDDNAIYLRAKNTLRGSQAASTLSSMESNTDDLYEVIEISGTQSLPTSNIDRNMELLLGLEKDKLYRFRYYQGTKEKRATFRADAKIFQSERILPITTPYRKTDMGYFIVNLPQNIQDGYYYLSDVGFFRYSRNEKTDTN